MKRIILLLVFALIIFGCGVKDKKNENVNNSKQAGIANTTNNTQTKTVRLMKKRNFKGLVSPFITKSPFEGTWLAEMRYKDGEITAITMRIEKVMKYGEKRVMSIRTRESKYWVSYDKNEINLPIQSRTHYINWSIGDFGRALEWELNDNNENAKYFRFDESGSITTWDYNSSNDTFHWTHVIGGNFKVGDLVYKRFNENDLMQIKEHSRQAKYHEKLYRGRKIIYK